MSKKPFELHSERLGTTDQDGRRIYLFLDEVKGVWERRRYYVYYALLALYIFVPWTKINGKQTLLINIAEREFFIFGHSFFAHNIPLLFVVLLSFILIFAIVTALWGRIWCGWACPQTVFIEIVFRKLESFIEGKANKRRASEYKKKSFEWYLRKTIKWIAFTIASFAISHSFMAYFVGAEKLSHIVFENPQSNWGLFSVSVFLAAIALFDFGWFREQFCIIMCPYGRIQSVFMDENSLVVGYDYNRGEPRGKPKDTETGDCVDCYRCVQVCPTGIDIRRGTQLECIHCTRCMDACDEIMVKVKKPQGLIRYATEHELEGNSRKSTTKRLYFYITVLILVISAGAYFINKSTELNVLFLRSTKDPYTLNVKEGRELVVNHYKVDLFYNETRTVDFNMKILKSSSPDVEIVIPIKKIKLRAARKKNLYVFFRAPKSSFVEGSINVEVGIYDGDKLLETKSMTILGPLK